MRRVLLLSLFLSMPIQCLANPVNVEEIQGIINKIHLQPSWRSINVDKNDPGNITLSYKSDPGNLAVVQADTRHILIDVLQGLVKEGHNPSKEWISLFVFGQQDGLTTVTGQPGVRAFGDSYYDYNLDTIAWQNI